MSTDDSEEDMQKNVSKIISCRDFGRMGNTVIPQIYREVHIPNFYRVSDIVIKISLQRIINIECKLTDHTSVFNQAKDHLMWADYSYICLHADALIPNYFISKIIKYGIGLLLWEPEFLIEPVMAYHNTYKNGKNKSLHDGVNKKLNELNRLKTAEQENNNQKQIEFKG